MTLGNTDYDEQRVIQERKMKDAALTGEDSPIPADKRSSFTGLDYFPIDPKMTFHVKLERLPRPEPFSMAATKGDVRKMQRVGKFTVEVEGKEQKLSAFSSETHPEMLFVPFKDATNGDETYEVGRYIDIEARSDDRYLLDFNRAYNPYCAYNAEYTCPIVPFENILDVSIRAGEKAPRDGAH